MDQGSGSSGLAPARPASRGGGAAVLSLSGTPQVLQDCVARIRDGDSAAFEVLFRELYPSVCSYLRRRTGSAAVAEELAQDLFVLTWERRAYLDPTRSVRAYLFRAARNLSSNHARRSRLERRGLAVLSRRAGAVAATESAETSELTRALAAAVDDLPTRCREVFTLSRSARLSYAEIASTLGVSRKTVENHMGRALQLLRRKLRPFLD